MKAFSKPPKLVGFAIEYTDPSMNLRSYYPDFVAVGQNGIDAAVAIRGGRAEGR